MTIPFANLELPEIGTQAATVVAAPPGRPNSILFVDDEPNVLSGIRRMLRPMRDTWDLEFVEGGPQALARLAEKSFEIVVSDMRMPGVDGVAVLREVMRRQPETLRIILSGQSDQQGVLHAVGCTHQFLSKPCDPGLLMSTISRAFALREQLGTPAVRRLTSGVQTLPSISPIYQALLAEVQSACSSINRVGEIILQDLALSAKLLQLALSSFAGESSGLSSPAHAAQLLGLDVMKSLVLSRDVFSQFAGSNVVGSLLQAMTRHSLIVGANAQAIAELENCDKPRIDAARTAGMLHDVGEAVLLAQWPESYVQVSRRAAERRIGVSAAECELLGATHAEVGAYLMGMWGLPNPIVEAIAFHHQPEKGSTQSFSPLTAVHVADALAHEIERAAPSGNDFCSDLDPQLDLEYLDRLGLADRLDVWRKACQANQSPNP